MADYSHKGSQGGEEGSASQQQGKPASCLSHERSRDRSNEAAIDQLNRTVTPDRSNEMQTLQSYADTENAHDSLPADATSGLWVDAQTVTMGACDRFRAVPRGQRGRFRIIDPLGRIARQWTGGEGAPTAVDLVSWIPGTYVIQYDGDLADAALDYAVTPVNPSHHEEDDAPKTKYVADRLGILVDEDGFEPEELWLLKEFGIKPEEHEPAFLAKLVRSLRKLDSELLARKTAQEREEIGRYPNYSATVVKTEIKESVTRGRLAARYLMETETEQLVLEVLSSSKGNKNRLSFMDDDGTQFFSTGHLAPQDTPPSRPVEGQYALPGARAGEGKVEDPVAAFSERGSRWDGRHMDWLPGMNGFVYFGPDKAYARDETPRGIRWHGNIYDAEMEREEEARAAREAMEPSVIERVAEAGWDGVVGVGKSMYHGARHFSKAVGFEGVDASIEAGRAQRKTVDALMKLGSDPERILVGLDKAMNTAAGQYIQEKYGAEIERAKLQALQKAFDWLETPFSVKADAFIGGAIDLGSEHLGPETVGKFAGKTALKVVMGKVAVKVVSKLLPKVGTKLVTKTGFALALSSGVGTTGIGAPLGAAGLFGDIQLSNEAIQRLQASEPLVAAALGEVGLDIGWYIIEEDWPDIQQKIREAVDAEMAEHLEEQNLCDSGYEEAAEQLDRLGVFGPPTPK